MNGYNRRALLRTPATAALLSEGLSRGMKAVGLSRARLHRMRETQANGRPRWMIVEIHRHAGTRFPAAGEVP
jgi:hypothetical protein